MRKDAAEKNGTLFRSAGCVESRITSELFTLKFKHVDAKCYPALFLRSNRSTLSLLGGAFCLLFALGQSASGRGRRRWLSFVMERKIPLLRLFVGPPARTQWSLTRTRTNSNLDLDMSVVFNRRHLARKLVGSS
ncbi:hypothetical protein LOK49_LG03G03290 [Camellia lanceoleosa]|uniref:Uncharacterized protein n=1 Tax=Camellia lanceoleosa TaxID=1840588 RepID=A0ACC0IEP4_9ERIC|nr:hypothetical protein LOK49_LG03G03290 [Camellia lanceoleosa]